MKTSVAVVVDYKGVGCDSPSGSPNSKTFVWYTLEWILIEGFDEVFVCCSSENATQMRAAVSKFSETENVPSTVTIQVHSSENNKSTGDCLRDLDQKRLIKSDFVIMDVGCCGNLPLMELLETHKALKKVDKNLVLTSVVRNVFTKNPAEISEFPIYITDPSTGLLLHYIAGRVSEKRQDKSSASKAIEKVVRVPSDIFMTRGSAKINTNLCSTNLSIYSADVPARFAELFDSDSEADLIQAMFDNEEVIGGSIYIHVVDDLFSQRMADFGFAINQKKEKFDTNLIYKRNDRYQVLRQLVNDSLIDCTRLNADRYLANLPEDNDSESETDSASDSFDGLDDDEIHQGLETFLCEVVDSLVRGYEESINNKNLVLEVNSSKHAYNISIEDVYSTIGKALLMLPEKLTRNKPQSPSDYWKVIDEVTNRLEEFLLNYMKNEDYRTVVIRSMEEFYRSKESKHLNEIVFAKVLHKFYEIDAYDENSIIEWFKNFDCDDESEKSLRSSAPIQKLIDILQADSDDNDDDDDD